MKEWNSWDGKVRLYCANNLDVLPSLSGIGAVVTDPPYGIKWGCEKWDYDVPKKEIWKAVLDVCLPGAHLVSFSSPRTYHRACAEIEDAGYQIIDMIEWIYGQGFPKSLNIARMIDGVSSSDDEWTPSVDAAKWRGYGTGLKPCHEPITLARKHKSEATIVRNCIKNGAGGINIDTCRIKGGTTNYREPREQSGRKIKNNNRVRGSINGDWKLGRFPANVIVNDEVSALLPPAAKSFFYCPKASAHDRGDKNHHPTVKPSMLMEYLCRLVCPPGGIVLDPYMGSGSTGKACVNLGMRFVGIEIDETFFLTAVDRISSAIEEKKSKGNDLFEEAQCPKT